MTTSRLDFALRSAGFAWPEGALLALRPEPGVSALPRDRTTIAHGFKPAHDAWAAAGYPVVPVAEGRFDGAYVAVPRARDLARQLVARAMALVAPGGLIVIDGAKTDGVESLLKSLKQLVTLAGSVSKDHGKVFWFPCPGEMPATCRDWLAPQSHADGFRTAPGVFSADAIDAGSALLAGHLPDLAGRVADLGAGWGYLSARALAKSDRIVTLDLVEAEWAALEAARGNITDARAAFHWADALSFVAPPYDVILSNPPFHPARKADPALGQGFIRAAARLLKPDGTLALVANRHLPYEHVLSDCFAEVATRADAAGFKVIHARRKRRSAKR